MTLLHRHPPSPCLRFESCLLLASTAFIPFLITANSLHFSSSDPSTINPATQNFSFHKYSGSPAFTICFPTSNLGCCSATLHTSRGDDTSIISQTPRGTTRFRQSIIRRTTPLSQTPLGFVGHTLNELAYRILFYAYRTILRLRQARCHEPKYQHSSATSNALTSTIADLHCLASPYCRPILPIHEQRYSLTQLHHGRPRPQLLAALQHRRAPGRSSKGRDDEATRHEAFVRPFPFFPFAHATCTIHTANAFVS